MPVSTPSAIGAASALVSTVLSESHGLALQSMSRGITAIQSLGAFDVDIPELDMPVFDVPVVAVPSAGAAPADPGNLTTTIPDLPTAPDQAALPALDVGEAPQYALAVPLLIDIDLPDPFDALAPAAPGLAVVGQPVEPDFTLPAVPSFASLNIPSAPVFDMPVFADTAPAAPSAIDVSFAWAEVEYASEQLTALNSELLALIDGEATGLPSEVEAAIWQRGCDAEAMLSYQAVENALEQTAARGFSIPGGQLVRIVQQAIESGLEKDAGLSRETMVSQARLEQSNFHFAFSNAMQLEGRLIDLFNQVQERAIDAEKFRVAALIDLFNARVALYSADVQAFGVKADAFKTRLQGALAAIDVYRAELEGLKIIGGLNVQLAEQYGAQVDGVKALAEVYRARVEAVTITVESNKNRTELYRAQIEAHAALAKGNAAQVQGYLGQVQAEQNKVELFSQQVAGYNSQVEAYRAVTSAKLADTQFQFRQLQEFPVALYKAKIGGYQAQVSAEAARLSATADVFRSRVDAYAAVERTQGQRAAAAADVLETKTKIYTSQARVSLQSGAINVSLAQLRSETAQVALRAAGQLSTQLASAALSARNVSATITGATSNSAGTSVSNNMSVSASNGFSSNSSTSTNSSSTTGVSNSATSSVSNNQSMAHNQSASESFENSVSNSDSISSSNETSVSARNASSTTIGTGRRYTTSRVYRHKE